jgi:hypothetical protein
MTLLWKTMTRQRMTVGARYRVAAVIAKKAETVMSVMT